MQNNTSKNFYELPESWSENTISVVNGQLLGLDGHLLDSVPNTFMLKKENVAQYDAFHTVVAGKWEVQKQGMEETDVICS